MTLDFSSAIALAETVLARYLDENKLPSAATMGDWNSERTLKVYADLRKAAISPTMPLDFSSAIALAESVLNRYLSENKLPSERSLSSANPERLLAVYNDLKAASGIETAGSTNSQSQAVFSWLVISSIGIQEAIDFEQNPKLQPSDLNSVASINLGASEAQFIANKNLKIELNGIELIKGTEAIWLSPGSIAIAIALDPGDFLSIQKQIKE
jgi:antitoxin component of RelBE/YafQ-DinJ toxin-antitoxin module